MHGRCFLAFFIAILALGRPGGSIAAETLTIVGTGDGIAVLKVLAGAFEATRDDIVVEVPDSIGSSGGIRAVGLGERVLGRVARPLRDTERDYGLSYRPFARIPVALLVNPSVRIDGLSVEQMLGIFSGRLTDWQVVGGQPGRIRVIRREQGDSSLAVLRKTIPGFDRIVFTENSMTTTTTQRTIEALTTIERTIGFGPAPEARGTPLRMLRIEGRAPYDPDYWSHTVLALIYKDLPRSEAARAFLDFLATPAAVQAIRDAGAIPF